MIPKKLICVSDSNELELVRTIKGKEITYEYQFTKSETKKGMLIWRQSGWNGKTFFIVNGMIIIKKF
jgi:hypothetical protein